VFERQRLAGWLRRVAPLRWGLKAAVRALVPTHYVGAVVAVFDEAGRVLLVEHVFRTDHPWGLPGGWLSRGESPDAAVVREVREELGLTIEIKALTDVARIPATRMANHPSHLGVAYCARLLGGQCALSGEVLSIRWADPDCIAEDLAPFQRRAIALGKVVFDRQKAPDEAG
jgi:8-oxo-dGTP pyrophosphatase MutT (NUDIX family)